MSKSIKVMLATEGTYPFHRGGVSTWCDILIKCLSSVDFVVYSILMNPFVRQKFELPPRCKLVKVPLWGTEEPSEHLTDIPFSQVYLAKRRTNEEVVREHFLPLFRDMVEEILSPLKSGKKLGRTLHEMYRYFREYDYHRTLKSQILWDAFKQMIIVRAQQGQDGLEMPNIFDLIQSMGWIYRFFIVLNTPVPRVDVAHSAAAAICGIPCVLAKLESGTPFLLTEHGVYLREQYISVARQNMSSYSKNFLINLVTSVVKVSYDLADQVSPVCAYNSRWEREMGVPQERIKVIYNGVDPAVFAKTPPVLTPRSNPTVVTVARVDPIKDMETLIRAAAIVREHIPDVRFIIYGSVSVPSYYEKCLNLRESLGLKETVIFAGHTDDVVSAYRSGDVVALSSISEAFPYSVIEAMMSGKAVVATDVGGVKEALEGCGLLVRPRKPEDLAAALIKLLLDDKLRATLADEARNKALTYFSISRAIDLYLESYMTLYERQGARMLVVDLRRWQVLYAQRGYAFAEAGMWQKAIGQFRQAIEVDVNSPAVPVLLVEISRAYNELGLFPQAINELEKAEAMASVLERGLVA
ncbi:MAG: GT4 family glycosyltransferase PelF [Firmicutes bacterium]|nr:GT4 family glycosyltransferase PelF [Bacillota bacterium]